MANELRFRATIKDDVSGPLERINDKFSQIRQQGAKPLLQGMAIGAGAAAFNMLGDAVQQVTGWLADSVRAAQEEQVGIVRLDASLRANVKNWNGNTDAIERHIAAMVKTSGFADNELRDSLARLVASTRDVNKAYAIQATAMDLARFKGISLAEASTALIKVEGGQYRALKELGIVLKQGATQTEALAEVQRVAGGQAAAYMETLAGKSEVLQNRLNDLQEELGSRLTPAFTTAAEKALGFMDALDSDSPLTATDRLKGVTDVLNVLNPATWGQALAWGEVEKRAAAVAEETGKAEGEAARSLDTFAEMGASLREVGTKAKTAGDDVKRSMKKMIYWAKQTQTELESVGSDAADALYDPIIEKAELAALKRERAEQRSIATSKNSTKEQVRDAKDRINELDKAIFEQQVKLIGMGKLNKKEQAAFLADLKEKWKTSTGDARVYIQRLIDQIEEIPRKIGVSIDINARTHFVGSGNDSGRATGGVVLPYRTYRVNEDRTEYLHTGSSSGVISTGTGRLGQTGTAGGGLTINVNGVQVLTPGGAQALADAIAPAITRWQQVRGV